MNNYNVEAIPYEWLLCVNQGKGKAMSMTKKDYELIASTIFVELCKYDEDLSSYEAVCGMAKSLAHELESTNPSFDYNKFLMACGVRTW